MDPLRPLTCSTKIARMAHRGRHGHLQPWARPFVRALLVAFVVCGLFGIEAWPLSGFRLFSSPRGDDWTSWRLIVVGETGDRTRLPVQSLPRHYGGLSFVARRISSMDPVDRERVCRTWIQAAESMNLDVEAIEVERLDHTVMPRDGNRPAVPPRRATVHVCLA
jgi:hypothetical protein